MEKIFYGDALNDLDEDALEGLHKIAKSQLEMDLIDDEPDQPAIRDNSDVAPSESSKRPEERKAVQSGDL